MNPKTYRTKAFIRVIDEQIHTLTMLGYSGQDTVNKVNELMKELANKVGQTAAPPIDIEFYKNAQKRIVKNLKDFSVLDDGTYFYTTEYAISVWRFIKCELFQLFFKAKNGETTITEERERQVPHSKDYIKAIEKLAKENKHIDKDVFDALSNNTFKDTKKKTFDPIKLMSLIIKVQQRIDDLHGIGIVSKVVKGNSRNEQNSIDGFKYVGTDEKGRKIFEQKIDLTVT